MLRARQRKCNLEVAPKTCFYRLFVRSRWSFSPACREKEHWGRCSEARGMLFALLVEEKSFTEAAQTVNFHGLTRAND